MRDISVIVIIYRQEVRFYRTVKRAADERVVPEQ